MMKKQWAQPQLIVLVRRKPEEAVLVTCKYDGSLGPKTNQDACHQGSGDCEDRLPS